MTTYRGIYAGGTTLGIHKVTVNVPGLPPRALEHRVLHSPDGYNWGFHGSGPADLARSLLWDVLGAEPHPACSQEFKRDFVATWPQDSSWICTDQEIQVWLARYEGPILNWDVDAGVPEGL